MLSFETINDELLLHSGKSSQCTGAGKICPYVFVWCSDLNEGVLLGVFGVASYRVEIYPGLHLGKFTIFPTIS